MPRWAIAVPVLSGKADTIKSITDGMRARMGDYQRSRTRAGVTLERVYTMQTPMGLFVIAYMEGAKDFVATNQSFVTSGDDFDRWFIAQLKEAHGIDITQPPPGPPPELLGEWFDPDVKERRKGLAFVAPVAPGKTQAGRSFCQEAFVRRRQELATSRRALGQNGEVVVLNATPQGDVVCVYLEGRDPVEGNRRFAASQSPFDTWFKQSLQPLFPPDIDFSRPLPPIEQVWDWVKTPVAA